MIKLLKYFGKGLEIILRFSYTIVGLGVISASMYLLGGYVYINGALGTDSISAFAMLFWIDKFFPNVPFWYPLAGGGISIIHAYPVFSFYIISFLKNISNLNLIQSFSLLGFSSIIVMALSIYAFVAIRFKNQTAALIASIFYLISPIAWTWLVDWGFYAESIAHTFAGPAILFWDLFFISFIRKDWGAKTRIYLFLVVTFLFLAMASHFLSGFALIRFFSFYVIVYTIFSKSTRKQIFFRGILALLIVGLLSYLSVLVYTVPFQNYAKVASQVGLSGGGTFKDISNILVGPLYVLGFKIYKQTDFLFAMNNFSFPSLVSVLAIIGVFAFSWRDKRMLVLASYVLFAFIFSLSPYYYWNQKYIPSILSLPLTSGTDWRSMFIVVRIAWPILAALAVTNLVSVPFFWFKSKYIKVGKGITVGILALLLVGYSLYSEGRFFESINNYKNYNYGAKGIDTRNIWNPSLIVFDRCKDKEKLVGSLEKDFAYLNGYKSWCDSPLGYYFPPLDIAGKCYKRDHELKDYKDLLTKIQSELVSIRELKDQKELLLRKEQQESSLLQKLKDQKLLDSDQKIEELPEICIPEKLTKNKVLSFWKKCQLENDEFTSILCKNRYLSIKEQLTWGSWPPFKLLDSYNPDAGLNTILEKIAIENSNARIDFSPGVSNYSMSAQYYNVNRNLSQMHLYVSTASLLLRFQGWQQGVFYLNLPQFSNPDLLNNLARWFGINYVFINERTDPKVFKQAGWQGSPNGFKFPEKNLLTDFSDKTAILVIGQNKLGAYDQVFETTNMGVLSYKDAFLIWGKESLDDYNLEELKNFDILLLHGYTYKNKGKTDKLLRGYVEQGGSVFIDTGWQYNAPDYKSERPLEIIPFNKLYWKDLGKASDYSLEEKELSKDIDVSKFGPLVYGDGAWAVSTSSKADLKDWGKVILSVKGYPLIVTGDMGQGKVVWSGMNIFPHIRPSDQNVYYEEIKLLKSLFKWLSGNKTGNDIDISYKRVNPDKVEFEISKNLDNRTYLLWKEGYYPDFKASLISKQSENKESKLSTYRAGPGFTIIRIPEVSAGDKVIYEYKKPFSEIFAKWISIVTFMFLFLLVLEGFRGNKSFFVKGINLLDKFNNIIKKFFKKPKDWIGKGNDEDTDY